jgi:hypothetical protein
MPRRVRSFESTPNPNALKCLLDGPAPPRGPGAAGPRSYRSGQDAAADPLAAAIMAIPGVTHTLIADEWLTVGKVADAPWGPIKARIRKVLDAQP